MGNSQHSVVRYPFYHKKERWIGSPGDEKKAYQRSFGREVTHKMCGTRSYVKPDKGDGYCLVITDPKVTQFKCWSGCCTPASSRELLEIVVNMHCTSTCPNLLGSFTNPWSRAGYLRSGKKPRIYRCIRMAVCRRQQTTSLRASLAQREKTCNS